MKIPAIILLLFGVVGLGFNQETVYFYASDGAKIGADLYLADHQFPYILLFHDSGSNRSAFHDIAPRLMNLNYNCLAVDLRVGGNVDFIENETLKYAVSENLPSNPWDAGKDLEAAVSYVGNFSQQPVILLGSGLSASLCMMLAIGNPDIRAVIAFSPGEYFQPRFLVEHEIAGFDKPLLVISTPAELPYVERMTDSISDSKKKIVVASDAEQSRGISILEGSAVQNDACWFELLLFFKGIASANP